MRVSRKISTPSHPLLDGIVHGINQLAMGVPHFRKPPEIATVESHARAPSVPARMPWPHPGPLDMDLKAMNGCELEKYEKPLNL